MHLLRMRTHYCHVLQTGGIGQTPRVRLNVILLRRNNHIRSHRRKLAKVRRAGGSSNTRILRIHGIPAKNSETYSHVLYELTPH